MWHTIPVDALRGVYAPSCGPSVFTVHPCVCTVPVHVLPARGCQVRPTCALRRCIAVPAFHRVQPLA